MYVTSLLHITAKVFIDKINIHRVFIIASCTIEPTFGCIDTKQDFKRIMKKVLLSVVRTQDAALDQVVE